MAAPSPPAIALDLLITNFPEGSGFRDTDDLIGFFVDYGYVIFIVSDGDWQIDLTARTLDADYTDSYPIPMLTPGEFLFGIRVVNEVLFVTIATNLNTDPPQVYYSYPCTQVNTLHLSGPTHPDSDILACDDYIVLTATFPDPPPNFTL
jgi:hypothetical protein